MKLLKTMTYLGFPEAGTPTITREAARIVLVDELTNESLLFKLYIGKLWKNLRQALG